MQSPVSALRPGDAPGLAADGVAGRARPADRGALRESAAVGYAAEPWSRGDVIQFVAVSGVGLVLLAAGWIGAGGEALFEEQMPFLNLAIAGILVGAVGGAMWLISGLRAVRLRKAAVKTLLAARTPSAPAGSSPDAAGTFVAGPSMTRYHHPECSLVRGKQVSAASPIEHERAGRRRCGMCQP